MSANDNAMTRFLFAILQQKCLKDIDWNKVAHDPILAQEITNGHAARMRYSRFRAQMLGLEPQKRKRDPNKTRVTKKKRDDKMAVKRDDAAEAKLEHMVKQEPMDETSSQDTSRPSTATGPGASKPSPKVKAEPSMRMATTQGHQLETSPAPSSVLSAAACAPPSMSDLHTQLHARLLTPCSDSDIMAAPSQAFTPGGDMFTHAEPTLDFGSPASHVHDGGMWHGIHSPSYSGFSVGGYGLENYSVAFCDHSHAMEEQHHPGQGQGHGEHHHVQHREDEHMGLPLSLMEQDAHHVVVKHEDWESSQYHV